MAWLLCVAARPSERRYPAAAAAIECPYPMIAALLRDLASSHRAWALASLWLLSLTIIDVQTGGAFRSTLLFAVPVALVAWNNWRLGFLFAGIAVLCARFAGAMPEPGSPSPLWLDGLLAFAKLSIDAVVVNAWGRRYRKRLAQADKVDGPTDGGCD